MMNIYPGILTILILFSCGKKSGIKAQTQSIIEPTEKIKGSPENVLVQENKNDTKTIDWKQFEKVFKYENKENEIVQMLGVKGLTPDSIEYQFYLNSVLCESSFSGKVGTKQTKGDIEIDEDENGVYPVNEYLFEGETYIISIRIEAENYSKARFIYIPKREADDCAPDEQVIMKKLVIRK